MTKRRGNWSVKSAVKKLRSVEGLRGIILTVEFGHKSKEAIREALALINDAANGFENRASEENIISGGVSSNVEKELEELKRNRMKFVPVESIVRAVNFIKFQDPEPTAEDEKQLVPSEVVGKILSKVVAEKTTNSRFVARLLPVDFSCKPHKEEFEKLAKEIIPQYFPDHNNESEDSASPHTHTWRCQFNRRNMNTIAKQEVYDIVTEIVGEKHKVNLIDPGLTIIIELNPQFCGLSVVQNWALYGGYNMKKILAPAVSETNKNDNGDGDAEDDTKEELTLQKVE